MFVIILLIFMNTNLISAEFDESFENRYIDHLPENEKKEFLEKVARRILEEVKSVEAQGVISGEVADELLNVHNNYVSKILREEKDLLVRRQQAKNYTNDREVEVRTTTEDTLQGNEDEIEKNIQDIEKAKQSVHDIYKENVNNSQGDLLLYKNDAKQEGQHLENTKEIKLAKAVDLTILERNQGKTEGQRIAKAQEQGQVIDLKSDKLSLEQNSKDDDHNLGKDDTQDLNNIQGGENFSSENSHKLRETREIKSSNETAADDISKSITTDQSIKTTENNITQTTFKTEPVSIEITFVNDTEDDDKTKRNKVNKNNEIPVKVIYDEDIRSTSSTTLQTDKPTEEDSVLTVTSETATPYYDELVEVVIAKSSKNTKNKEKVKTRKSLLNHFDEIQQNDRTSEDQVARKKRTSKNNTESKGKKVEVSTKSIDEGIQNTEQRRQVKEIADNNSTLNVEQTVMNNNSNLRSDSSKVKDKATTTTTTTLKTTEKSPFVEADKNLSTSVLLNITDEPLHLKLESTTKEPDIQQTVIDNFEADDNETVPHFVTLLNFTGSTTEEIVKMRTQIITGYPEDSTKEDSTETVTLRNKIQQPSMNVSFYAHKLSDKQLEPTINSSFYAHKLSDNDDTDSSNIQNKTTSVTLKTQQSTKKTDVLNLKDSKNNDLNSKTQNNLVESNVSEPKLPAAANKYISTLRDNTTADITLSPDDAPIPKNSIIGYITTTTIAPLTTPEIMKKQEFYYAVEAPVEITNDSLTIRKDKNTKEEKSSNPRIVLYTEDSPKKSLRQDQSTDTDDNTVIALKHDTNKKNSLVNIWPAKKEYIVYELLPGEQPFKKSESNNKKAQKKNPKRYPKLPSSFIGDEKKSKKVSFYLEKDQPSQIEQPSFAPVYNYAPENAYYNPKNKYTPNSDDEEAIIVDERSNETDLKDIYKLFDYDVPKQIPYKIKQSINENKNDHVSRSERPMVFVKKTDDADEGDNRVHDDYYFGYLNKKVDKKEVLRSHKSHNTHRYEKNVLNNSLEHKKHSSHDHHEEKINHKDNCNEDDDDERCKETIFPVVMMDAKFPPNSDEPDHAHNALLNRNPPITHFEQVKTILNHLGYHGYNYNSIYRFSKNKKTRDKDVNSSETWLGPNIDLFYNKRIDKYIRKGTAKALRSGAPYTDLSLKSTKKSPQKRRYVLKIPLHGKKSNKIRLEYLNRTFNAIARSQEFRSKKRPMVLLTGRLDDAQKGYKIRKQKKVENSYDNKYYVSNQKSSEERNKLEKSHIFMFIPKLLEEYNDAHDKKYEESSKIQHKSDRPRASKIIPKFFEENIHKDKINDKQILSEYENQVRDPKIVMVIPKIFEEKFDEDNINNRKETPKREHKEKKPHIQTIIPKLFEEYVDVEKKIERNRESDSSDFDYKDPSLVTSGSSAELKTLNVDTVKLILDMAENAHNSSLQKYLIQVFRDSNQLYDPPKRPPIKKFDVPDLSTKSKKKKRQSLRSNNNLEAFINVMEDMIQTDNKALNNYDFLETTVDIRSALKKLIQMGDILHSDGHNIHPKDLQILKYVLYLFDTTKYLFEEDNYDEISISDEDYLSARRYLQKPWESMDGMKEKVEELTVFLKDLRRLLDDLHRAIKHIALVTKYRSQRWFQNLKDIYLAAPTRKLALELILHLECSRLFSLIENSAENGLSDNYVKYSIRNPKEVEKAREEFAFVVRLYLKLKKLQ